MTKKTGLREPTGATRAVKIDAGVIDRALKGERKGRIRFADTVCTGLRLVVGARSTAWEYSYRPRGVADGGKRHKARTINIGDVTTKTPNEARAEVDAIKRDVAAGRDPMADKEQQAALAVAEAARRTTIAKQVEIYVDTHLGTETKYQRNEATHLRAAIAELKCGSLEPSALDVADVKRLANLHRAKPATGFHRVGALRRFLECLVEDRVIKANPVMMLSKKSKPKPRSLARSIRVPSKFRRCGARRTA